MTELLIKIKDTDALLARQILERMGAEVLEQKPSAKKAATQKKAAKKQTTVSPTFLFGKWKDFDIDARELRKAAWDRSSKFL